MEAIIAGTSDVKANLWPNNYLAAALIGTAGFTGTPAGTGALGAQVHGWGAMGQHRGDVDVPQPYHVYPGMRIFG
jgi:hypothetical protein